jgi:hypothetical protein
MNKISTGLDEKDFSLINWGGTDLYSWYVTQINEMLGNELCTNKIRAQTKFRISQKYKRTVFVYWSEWRSSKVIGWDTIVS